MISNNNAQKTFKTLQKTDQIPLIIDQSYLESEFEKWKVLNKTAPLYLKRYETFELNNPTVQFLMRHTNNDNCLF